MSGFAVQWRVGVEGRPVGCWDSYRPMRETSSGKRGNPSRGDLRRTCSERSLSRRNDPKDGTFDRRDASTVCTRIFRFLVRLDGLEATSHPFGWKGPTRTTETIQIHAIPKTHANRNVRIDAWPSRTNPFDALIRIPDSGLPLFFCLKRSGAGSSIERERMLGRMDTTCSSSKFAVLFSSVRFFFAKPNCFRAQDLRSPNHAMSRRVRIRSICLSAGLLGRHLVTCVTSRNARNETYRSDPS